CRGTLPSVKVVENDQIGASPGHLVASSQQVAQYAAFVRRANQSLVQPLVRVMETVWIQTQHVKDRGLQVANADRLFHRIITELVGLAVGQPAAHSAAR